jgi:flagellar motor switch protein FliM
MLLCELCLGGTGLSGTRLDSDRPISKFEKRLKAAVADSLIAALPESARLAHGVSWGSAGPPPEDAVLREPMAETCICLKVLINAFALAAEFSILFQQSELEHGLQLAAYDEPPSQNTVRPALEGCLFELQVYLKPQLVAFDKIMDIKPGQFIALNTSIASAVSVHFEDAHVFDATINLSNDAINVQLAQLQPAEAVS